MPPGRNKHHSSRDSFLTMHRRTVAVFLGSFSRLKSQLMCLLWNPHIILPFTCSTVRQMELSLPQSGEEMTNKYFQQTGRGSESRTRVSGFSTGNRRDTLQCHTKDSVFPAQCHVPSLCEAIGTNLFFSPLVSFLSFLEVDEVPKLLSNQATRPCNFPPSSVLHQTLVSLKRLFLKKLCLTRPLFYYFFSLVLDAHFGETVTSALLIAGNVSSIWVWCASCSFGSAHVRATESKKAATHH